MLKTVLKVVWDLIAVVAMAALFLAVVLALVLVADSIPGVK